MEIEKIYYKAEELNEPYDKIIKAARVFDIAIIEKEYRPSSLIHKKDIERLKKAINSYKSYNDLCVKIKQKQKALSNYRMASRELKKLQNKIDKYHVQVLALRAKKNAMLKLI